MTKSAVILAGVLCLFFIGCDGDSRCTVCPDEAETWYFNSFESSGDTTGWRGITEAMFVNDPAPGCGSQSLAKGTADFPPPPPSWRVFPPLKSDGRFTVSFWAKSDSYIYGSVELAISEPWNPQEPRRSLLLRIHNHEWTFHEADEPLFCPAGDSLVLEIRAGSMAPAGAVYIDCIKIEKLE